jgi:hypothetical protein
VLVVFAAGVEVGYMKAGFNYKFGEGYYRSFGQGGMHPAGLVPGDVGQAHGVTGTIVNINTTGFVIAERDNTEKVVRISDDTIVRVLRGTIPASNLKVGDSVVVLGDPNANAEIEAKLIRVIPQ